MKNTNVTVTPAMVAPNINGNVGSCSIESNTVQSHGGMFVQEFTSTQVNSCTGEIVLKTSYNDYSNLWAFIVMTVVILVIATISTLVAIFGDKTDY